MEAFSGKPPREKPQNAAAEKKTEQQQRKTVKNCENKKKLWNFLGNSENSKKQRKIAKDCRQFPACTVRRVPLSSL